MVPFGSTGLTVSGLGLGGAQLGGIFGGGNPQTWVRLVQDAIESGVRFFDTADSYTQGESERLLGRALGPRRQHVVIATKAGYCLPVQKRLGGRIKPLLRPIVQRLGLRRGKLSSAFAGSLTQDFSPSYLIQAAERSLRRLGTDYIDVYQLHSPPPSVIRDGDWVEALERLQREGKIRCYGVACDQTDDGLAALEHKGVSALQVSLSLLEQRAVDGLIPQARGRGIGIIARQPFAAGFLTRPLDRLDRLRADDPTWTAERARIEAFRALAAGAGLSPSALALRFVRGVPGVSVILLGVSNAEQLAANVRLLEQPPLPPELFTAARSILKNGAGTSV